MGALAKRHSLATTVSWVSFIWSVPIEENLFFLGLEVTLSLLKLSLLFYNDLLDFKRGSNLIQLKQKLDNDTRDQCHL